MNNQADIVVLGSLNADLVQKVSRIPRAGETLQGSNLETFGGGKGANQAFAAARLAGRAAMVGQVGDDHLGRLLTENLASAGVDVSAVGLSDQPTGAATIWVLPDGENLIVISPGAKVTLTPDLAASRLARLRSMRYLLCQLESPIETVERALAIAKHAGATTILDPAPAQTLPRALLRTVDVLTPNETEALTLLDSPGDRIETPAQAEDAATRLLELGAGTVVLKLGHQGCFVAAAGIREHVADFSVQPVDTTAAGDTFNGGLAVALAEGKSLSGAARFANAAAALSTTRPGAQNSIPGRDEVERLLQGSTR